MRPAPAYTGRENAFPYLATGPATHTDGSLGASDPTSTVDIGAPQQVIQPAIRGNIIPSGIGNTDYVDCNKVTHSVFAGNA